MEVDSHGKRKLLVRALNRLKRTAATQIQPAPSKLVKKIGGNDHVVCTEEQQIQHLGQRKGRCSFIRVLSQVNQRPLRPVDVAVQQEEA